MDDVRESYTFSVNVDIPNSYSYIILFENEYPLKFFENNFNKKNK